MQYYNERVERMSRDEKHALQSERLKKVVKLAYERCKPYRQKMIDAGVTPEDINSIDDIVKFILHKFMMVLCQEKVPVKMRNMHSYTQLPVHCIDFFL